MAEVFTILDNGETLITGEWVPPPDDIAARLIGLAGYLENMTVPMAEAREFAIQTTKEHFDSEEDPQKNPWESLTPEWLGDKRKQSSAFPESILKMTGKGYEAATSEEAYFITENEIWFDPSALPDYMVLHQRGTTAGGVSEALAAAGEGRLTGKQARVLGKEYGRGKNLPKREFIGFDEFDILAVEEIFNNWFADGVEFFSGDGGIIQEFGSNALGSFPIISTTKMGQPILRTPFGPRFGRMR